MFWIKVYIFWSNQGVNTTDSRGDKGTTVRYSSKKWHYREGEGTTLRYFAVSGKF
ncbi:hypothetical protein GCM10008018_07140 [Paenibacillus marchantiophytorum]|uniref:Uncharacterized protein n=1 Tax=Paenibacillus marchantiophytorum TaxID=1619310 RepID=A0ABQ2BPE5_9BACL|nr:hypothetical protein GCM10008018_07140 [Paenibacillus marchantiophytorum]